LQNENIRILNAVRLVKYCTGAEIITVGLHTPVGDFGRGFRQFTEVLNLIGCWAEAENEFETISELSCKDGYCGFPAFSDLQIVARNVRKKKCLNSFYLPEVGDYNELFYQIKQRRRFWGVMNFCTV